MSTNPADRHSLLRPEGSDLSDTSTAINSPQPASPQPSAHLRHGYHRTGSDVSLGSNLIDPNTPPLHNPIEQDGPAQGLGIFNEPKRAFSFARRPVGSRASLTPSTPPTPSNPFLDKPEPSPSSSASFTPTTPPWHRYDTPYDGPGLRPVTEADEDSISKGKHSSFTEGLVDTPDDFRNDSQFRSIAMHNDNDTTRLTDGCPSTHDIHSKRTHWLSISILFLSIYSTVFSGIWLGLALSGREWKQLRSSGSGGINVSTARTIFAFFAKTIELSFVTVFVTFLGQVLSRRSLMRAERGVTISEMTMRSWVIQPGSMITHWHNLQHAGLSVLGMITLTAAFVAMFYTTASDALVSPHLKFGKLQEKVLFGSVRTSYANTLYVASSCQTPVTTEMDKEYYGTTCLQIQHAGQSYHNGIAYLRTWDDISNGFGISSDIKQRPPAPAMLYDNTTVTGSWVFTETSDMTRAYADHKRIVNNITLAMPHAGIFAAARHGKNNVVQPEQLDGIGKYEITAAVVSPSVNVMCVNANEDELAPIIYATWPGSNLTFKTPQDEKAVPPTWVDKVRLEPGKEYLNSTSLDSLFHWGKDYQRQPPIFPVYPKEYNSLVNATMNYGSDAYLLIKAPNITTTDYTLCQLKSFHTYTCSTRYNVSGINSGHLQSYCDYKGDKTTYIHSVADALTQIQSNWKDIASEWLNALALGTGISNANAANARMLSQFIHAPSSDGSVKLNPYLPSIAEHLAVLAGGTLLASSLDSTFQHHWDRKTPSLDPPGVDEAFNGTIISQQYASGYTLEWERVFYVVLFLVFGTNIFCLIYFFVYSGLVTDFTEQQNLFALAVNSPPARRLSGSCGAGPEGDQLNINFSVRQDANSGHYYVIDSGHGIVISETQMRKREQRRVLRSQNSYQVLSSKRGSWL